MLYLLHFLSHRNVAPTVETQQRLDDVDQNNVARIFYVLLTVNLRIIIVNDQLDAQLFYFIIRLLQSSTCFEQRRAHHQDVKLY